MMVVSKSRRELLSLLALCLCYTLSILLATVGSNIVTASARGGMRLAIEVILPSVLPFMILSDIMSGAIDFSQFRRSGRLFSRVFGLGRCAIGAIIIGTLAGFPIGARMAAQEYELGSLSKAEAERAVIISSTPSLAFVVSGVGGGMIGDTGVGLVLYISVLAASLIYGFLTRRESIPGVENIKTRRRVDLARSISSAATACLGIVISVTLFSVITGILCEVIKSNKILSLILPFIEVSTSCSRLCEFGGVSSLILIAFALGFSGISVHMQIRSALADTDLGYSRFLCGKLAVGILSALIFSLLHVVIK